ncbi:hypothetical protein SERLA73DRAFT_173594 [Serpula lacrymans var. lacrymans S7.3]|uniref:Uncharacterized protein n=2 Tax=Serpula lacrymans var. lacrymans TaxID=341189 RepID=F8PEW3_SERL3|nr:uncharacterized protein SERLADRAFT_454375 [Serpula lacrymans var. lacrymans S7.9]EGO04174.1 hypothetical protein SERLA73DRAFT_173594 [Serpula lacrymans var. lacrymans S7.3]EGO30118.1 hypothetical protein SERLADRAFT_454375 [Serpula lacrymans var. lacrymans S7.9]
MFARLQSALGIPFRMKSLVFATTDSRELAQQLTLPSGAIREAEGSYAEDRSSPLVVRVLKDFG